MCSSRIDLIRQRLWGWRIGAVLFLIYLALALLWWTSLVGRFHGAGLGGARGDAGLFISWLQWAAHSWTHGLNPLRNDYVQAPYGVSAVWNTSILALGIPLTPITYLFGAGTSYNLIIVLSPVLSAWTASKWLRRHAGAVPAGIGGLLFGFSPYMIGQSAGHAHLTFLALIPLIVMCLEDLFVRSERPIWPTAPILGLLIALQYFISSEVLLMLAIGVIPGVVVLIVLNRPALRRRAARVVVAGAVAVGVAVVLLVVPLIDQFSATYRIDQPILDASVRFASWRYLINPTAALRFIGSAPAPNVVENTVYVGWPLLAVLVIAVVALRRRMAVWVAVTVALAALSCELNFPIAGHNLSPLAFIHRHISLTANILPMRFSSVFYLAAAFLVALGVKELLRVSASRRWVGVVGGALVVVALLALTPGKTRPAPAYMQTPAFFTSGALQQTVPQGATVMIAPLASAINQDAEYWQVKADFWFKQLGAYDLNNSGTGRPSFYPRQKTLVSLFGTDRTGKTVAAKKLPAMLAAARTELSASGSTYFILGPSTIGFKEQRALAVQLLGREPDLTTGGVQIWRLADKCGTDASTGPVCPALRQ